VTARHTARAAAILVLLVAGAGAPDASALETRARSGPLEVRVSLAPDAPRIGDPLTLDVEAVAEPGVEVLMPEFGEALDRFTIVDFTPRERLDGAGRTVSTQRYTLQAPASGDQRIPSILVEFVDRRPGQAPAPEGEDAYELLTDPIPFTVASVVPDSAEADLSPPLGRLAPRESGATRPWLWLLAVVAGLAATGPFAWRAFSRWRTRASERSAWEVARAELDALLAAPRPTPERIDAFFVALSGVVRRYLERRFGLRSPELTTERFLEVVSGSPDLSDAHQMLLRDFLRECDLVKFAHVIPSDESIAQAIASASRFIDETGEPVHEAGPAAPAEEAAA